MFNVIKGNFVKKNTEPVVIKHKKNTVAKENEDLIKKNEQKIENEIDYEEEYYDETEEKSDEFDNFELDEILLSKQNELKELEIQMEKLKQEAENEAYRIIEEARIEAEKESNDIKAKAWDQGYQEGYEAGKNQVLLNSSNVFSNVQRVLEEAMNEKEIMLNNSKEEIINLIIKVAEKVIKIEVNNKEILKQNLLEALKNISVSPKITVYVNWEQVQYAKELKEEMKSKFYNIEEFNILEDKTLTPGGCVIETQMGRVDASIETQLETIIDKLHEE
ncbi:flagellar assembly protein FliH [Hypnocyclicus thermotrophus]|uniref:Flagellar assembly protein FliH n=1 Tax=Hypnocyclicus thermotrophus TaxID=1627895 RepID=A0AA46I5A9_9FUSO|nr:FliH/SctL family protein [Hypnocyclicus thermotrophus]TDT69138.1 flagellar assembly protein FliH [Hypnocyclicus thermotrophus]